MSEPTNEPNPAPYVYQPVDAGATHEGGAVHIYLVTRDPYGRDPLDRVAYELDTAPAPAGPEQHTVPSTAEGEEH